VRGPWARSVHLCVFVFAGGAGGGGGWGVVGGRTHTHDTRPAAKGEATGEEGGGCLKVSA